MIDFPKILALYNIDPCSEIKPYGNGLINKTFLISNDNLKRKYIFQQINQSVFRKPPDIDSNISLIKKYLRDVGSPYFISLPICTHESKLSMVEMDGEFYRIFDFLNDTRTFDTINDVNQAYHAAAKFGEFTATLKVDTAFLKITIPDFHNLELRFDQFRDALQSGNTGRIRQCGNLINHISNYSKIVDVYKKISTTEDFKKRITHHDTKISNVLFDHSGTAMSIIDLDTVMPGYFISDFGDMMRTYLSPVSEEEPDFSKISIRGDIYSAIKDGYLEKMNRQLSEIEKGHLFYSGQFMVYMQALRFLTDYLNMDKYYGAKYEEQNYIRAANQLTLLERLYDFEKSLA